MQDLKGSNVRIYAHIHHTGKYYSVDEQYVGKKLSILEDGEQFIADRHGDLALT